MKKSEWKDYRSRIAYLFQNNALFDSMTVFDNVAFPLRQTTNFSKGEIGKRVLKRIEDLELTEAAEKYPVGALGRHAETGGPGAGPGDGSEDRAF